MFHNNFKCSGLATDGEFGTNGCHTLGSTHSIKSFKIQCASILKKKEIAAEIGDREADAVPSPE